MAKKICIKCELEKPLEDFMVRSDTGKLRPNCRDCYRLYQKEYSAMYAEEKRLKAKMHIDHMVPLVRNGTNLKENLEPICIFCNISKGHKTKEEYVQWLKR
jgi:5-methylcytosine-specific restriction endonuclease McrA